jgi:aerobic carbon-monoxide dehydrogenase small subunit
MRCTICFSVNGDSVEVEVRPHWNLLRVLREELDLTGAKQGCGEGECGACTVLVDGAPVNSCLYPIMEVEGKEVLTIEGLVGRSNELHPIQQAFLEKAGVQCGFCTPGMIMSAKALLDSNPHPTEEEIRHALAGNMCRCTGYIQIVESIQLAAEIMSRRQGGDCPSKRKDEP